QRPTGPQRPADRTGRPPRRRTGAAGPADQRVRGPGTGRPPDGAEGRGQRHGPRAAAGGHRRGGRGAAEVPQRQSGARGHTPQTLSPPTPSGTVLASSRPGRAAIAVAVAGHVGRGGGARRTSPARPPRPAGPGGPLGRDRRRGRGDDRPRGTAGKDAVMSHPSWPTDLPPTRSEEH